jgi:alkanesulfonate monooxygenase SsuD/methylene tetrahydromethanopterin reductase-like flavin-dependent oxidoreductase (luciferase family)
VIEGALGLATASPLEHLREYLSVLVPLVRTGSVDHQGELYRTTLSVAVPGADPVPVLVGALSPASAALAASHADGIVTWLAGPETLGSVLVPAVREGHAAGGGAVTPDGRPVVAAALPVAVTDDPAGYRSAAKEIFGRYATLENYQRLFAREGVGGVEDLAVVGGEAEVEDRLRALADLGVTDLWPVVFGPEGADLQDGARTEALLRSLVG